MTTPCPYPAPPHQGVDHASRRPRPPPRLRRAPHPLRQPLPGRPHRQGLACLHRHRPRRHRSRRRHPRYRARGPTARHRRVPRHASHPGRCRTGRVLRRPASRPGPHVLVPAPRAWPAGPLPRRSPPRPRQPPRRLTPVCCVAAPPQAATLTPEGPDHAPTPRPLPVHLRQRLPHLGVRPLRRPQAPGHPRSRPPPPREHVRPAHRGGPVTTQPERAGGDPGITPSLGRFVDGSSHRCTYSPSDTDAADCGHPATWHIAWTVELDCGLACDTHMAAARRFPTSTATRSALTAPCPTPAGTSTTSDATSPATTRRCWRQPPRPARPPRRRPDDHPARPYLARRPHQRRPRPAVRRT